MQLPHDAVDLAPSDLTAEAADGGVDLSWSAPAEDADTITGYEVLRAVGEGDMATLVADTASTATTYTDATATGAGETYAYRVEGIRGQARSRDSNRVALVPVEPPATPENLKPTDLTFEIREDGVTLAWDAPGRRRGFRDRVPGAAPPPRPGREGMAGVGNRHRLHRDQLPGRVRPDPRGVTTCTGCAPCAGTTTARCRTAST